MDEKSYNLSHSRPLIKLKIFPGRKPGTNNYYLVLHNDYRNYIFIKNTSANNYIQLIFSVIVSLSLTKVLRARTTE